MKPLLIYVASPLSPTLERPLVHNVNQAMRAGLALIRKGHHCHVPHLHILMAYRAEGAGQEIAYEQWMSLSLALLAHADALLYLASSPGADRELAFAQEHGLAIYRSVDEVPEVTP